MKTAEEIYGEALILQEELRIEIALLQGAHYAALGIQVPCHGFNYYEGAEDALRVCRALAEEVVELRTQSRTGVLETELASIRALLATEEES